MNTEDYVEEYIDFVQDMINKYKSIGDLVDTATDEITPAKINTALSKYYNVSLALCAEYQRAKINYEAKSIEFQNWKDTIFEQAKAAVLAEYSETKIKPSVTEFETRSRTLNAQEYTRRTMELHTAESKMRFLLRMLDTLNKYDSILTAISYNMRSELRALSLDDRMNGSIEGVNSNRVRGGFPENPRGRRVPVEEEGV